MNNGYSDIGKYIEFELLTYYIQGAGRNLTYTEADYLKRKTYTVKDFKLGAQDIIYSLNIADDVEILGDANNLNLT